MEYHNNLKSMAKILKVLNKALNNILLLSKMIFCKKLNKIIREYHPVQQNSQLRIQINFYINHSEKKKKEPSL